MNSKLEVFHLDKQFWLLVFFMCLIGSNSLIAQKKYEISYRQVGDQQGLSQISVTSIVQDTVGFIWLGTNDGLNRYDGLEMKVFKFDREDSTSLSNGWVNRLLYDKSGRLWVGTNRGLNIFNPEKQNFYRVGIDNSGKDTLQGVPHGHILDLYEDSQHRIWVSAWSTLVYTYDGKTFYKPKFTQKANFPKDYVNRIIQSKNGDFWIGMYNSGLLKYDSKSDSIIQYLTFEINKRNSEPKDILSITEDPITEDIWIGTKMNGLFRFHPQTGTAITYDVSGTDGATMASNIQNQLHSNGRFWIGNSMGLFEYNRQKDVFEAFQGINRSNEYIKIYCLFIDASENFWIGTELNGSLILDLKPKKFKSIPNRSLPSPITWSMFEDKDEQVWIATETGMAIMDSTLQKGKQMLTDSENPIKKAGDFLISVTGYDDKIWVGTTFSGVFEIDRNTLEYKHIPFGQVTRSSYINILEFNSEQKRLYVGTLHGMGVYDYESKKLDWYKGDTSSADSLPVNIIWDFYFAKDGSVWLTHDEGISRFNPLSKSFKNLKVFTDDYVINPSQTTNIIAEDLDGNLWIGTENGLVYYNLLNEKTEYIFSMKDGLANDYIYGLLVDSNNDVWVSTNKGISKLTTDMSYPGERRIRNFSEFDGLSSSEYNFNASIKTENGRFLFGGINGVNYFRPNAIENNLYRPKQFISQLDINTGTQFHTFSLFNHNQIQFNYGSHVYEITMHALEFTSPQENVYKFRLNGFDTNWREQTGKNKVIYTNLSPGTYQFEFKSSNNDKIYSNETIGFELVIIPPFYSTVEFYSGIILFIGVIIFWGISYREKKLIQQNEYLEAEIQKRAKELEKNQFIFKQISDNAADLISMLDSNGIILYASPSHHQLLGFSEEELMNKSLFQYIHEEDNERIKFEMEKLKTEGVLTFSEYRMKHKNGTWRSYQTAGSVIRFEDDESQHRFVMISHDITRQKRIENYLIESKNEALRASQSKSAFLAGISHELRTPLNAILGFSQILAKETNLTIKQQNYVDTMLKSGNHLLEMINEVLDISRIEAGKMPLNYDSIALLQLLFDIENLFGLQIKNKGIQFETEFSSNLPQFCYTDAGKVRQVIINLMGNALKFTEKGKIEFGAEYVVSEKSNFNGINWNSLEETLVNAKQASFIKGVLILKVKDTGRGISKEKLEQIFEPFQQAETRLSYSEGTGLGLAISSRLIRLLGGTILTESELGVGSEFIVTLPVLELENTVTRISLESEKPKRIKDNQIKKVLIVDDIEYNHTLLKEMLTPIGFVCSTVYNGKEAIEMTEVFKPDIILMDLRMPVMDGIESTRLIRLSNTYDVKILAISASGFDDNYKDPKKSGFDDFLLKPFKEFDLYKKMADLLSIEYDYTEQVNPESPKLISQDTSLLVVELKQLSIENEAFIDAIELAEWDFIQKNSSTLDAYPLLKEKLEKALHDKDLMLLLNLTELIHSNT